MFYSEMFIEITRAYLRHSNDKQFQNINSDTDSLKELLEQQCWHDTIHFSETMRVIAAEFRCTVQVILCLGILEITRQLDFQRITFYGTFFCFVTFQKKLFKRLHIYACRQRCQLYVHEGTSLILSQTSCPLTRTIGIQINCQNFAETAHSQDLILEIHQQFLEQSGHHRHKNKQQRHFFLRASLNIRGDFCATLIPILLAITKR